MAEEYFTFKETIQQLGISEDDLLNLVSGNQLRAFRIDRETKFRREDVEQLKASGGAAPVSAAESRVLELDELPDDVVMLDESDSNDAPAATEELLEPLEVLEESPFEELPAQEEDSVLDIFGDEAAAEAPAEEPLDLSMSDDIGTMEIEQESNPEFEETIVTDSSSLQNTEELSLDDDDSVFSTQEITIQEDAISEDEISSGETLTDETMSVDDEYEESQPARRQGRTSASAAVSAVSSRGRRSLNFEKASTTNIGDLVWTGILAALVIVMLYPASLLGTLLFYGYTTGRDTIAPGQQSYDGKVGNISPVFIPSWFQWIRDKDVKEYFGYPTFNGKTLKGNISFEEREKKGMLKLPALPVEAAKPAAEAEKPAVEEDKKPAEGDAK